MPIVWAWEYGSRTNLSEVKEHWYPLVKGECDFFACFLQELPENDTHHDNYLHDVGDCTNESPGKCAMRDTVLTLSMMRRSFDVISEMAAAIGEPVDPKWDQTLARVTPDPLGWFHGDPAEKGYRMGNISHECSFCGSNVSHGPPTTGDCQGASNSNGVLRGVCARSVRNPTTTTRVLIDAAVVLCCLLCILPYHASCAVRQGDQALHAICAPMLSFVIRSHAPSAASNCGSGLCCVQRTSY